MRINTAKDDAAGLSISERMSAQIMGMNQAVRNANDGVSLAQTAEGDLAQITTNLQRIRELSVQAANATNSQGDRATIQAEVAQLKSEIDRVAQASSFNGVKLIDGSFTDQSFQVGADNNSNNSVTLSGVVNARTSVLGASSVYSYLGANVNTTAMGASDLLINGAAIRATVAADDTYSTSSNFASAIAKARAINEATNTTGVSATVGVTTSGPQAMTGAALTGTITINGVSTASITTSATAATASAQVTAAINLLSTRTGVVASDGGATGVTLTAADGRNIQVTLNTLTAVATGVMARAAGSESTAAITLKSSAQFTIAVGGSGTANTGLTASATGAGTFQSAGTSVSTIDVTDATGANAKAAIDIIDTALNTINSARASLGAIQNRFSSVVVSLQTSSENLSASRSRIRDTDFAAEVAGLTRNQILQQAGTAMLAQANSLPQTVLSLLK
jgi:flagellin